MVWVPLSVVKQTSVEQLTRNSQMPLEHCPRHKWSSHRIDTYPAVPTQLSDFLPATKDRKEINAYLRNEVKKLCGFNQFIGDMSRVVFLSMKWSKCCLNDISDVISISFSNDCH